MTIKPLTKRLFGKENIRQIIRKWIEEQKTKDRGDKKRLTEEVIEHNIEWFEGLFMKSLHNFIFDTKKFYISTVCYKQILDEKETGITEEYISILQREVKKLFLGGINDKEHTLNRVFEEYLCLETIEGLFYKDEIYKYFKFHSPRGDYGYRFDEKGREIYEEQFCLVPQGGKNHLIVDKNKFKKRNGSNYR